MEFGQKIFHEIGLFDFTRLFFSWTFLNFLAAVIIGRRRKITYRSGCSKCCTLEIEQSGFEREYHWTSRCQIMAPIREAIWGQDEAVLNLLNQFVSDSFGIESLNWYTVIFGCYNEQLAKKLNHFVHWCLMEIFQDGILWAFRTCNKNINKN